MSHRLASGGFHNPWPSFKQQSMLSAFKMMVTDYDRARASIKARSPACVPLSEVPVPKAGEVSATWLGHASFLVQVGGVTILTDPVFSRRCSPSQWVGPARFTEPPCTIEKLPHIDFVLISHNHYDHLDVDTIQHLAARPDIHFYVPEGNKQWFTSMKIDNATELDWWQTLDFKSSLGTNVKLTCTPAQHFSSRSAFDRNATLWCSWAVHTTNDTGKSLGKYYFAGDTGYCAVPRELGEINPHDADAMKNAGMEMLPVCPAFKEIGAKCGPFDLCTIPIGAYSPRPFMSPIHCCPEDAVQLHMDVKSKFSVGMHWGTWILTDEDPNEPPVRLAAELERLKIKKSEFIVCDIGETVSAPFREIR